MAATATWMLRHRPTNKFVWQKQGAAPPEVVVDPKLYAETFTLSFPSIHIAWGPGDYDMLISSPDGGTFKVGAVRLFAAPDFSTENRAMVVAGSPMNLKLREEGDPGVQESLPIQVGARVAPENPQDEARQVLGTTGIPGGLQVVDSFQDQRPGQDQGGSLGSPFRQDAPRANPPAEVLVLKATPDAPDYLTLLGQVRRCCIPVERTFADRLRAIPQAVVEHYAANPEGINLETVPLQGRKFIGMQVDGKTYQLPADSFLHDECSPKTRLYIRWWLNYQEIEEQLEAQLLYHTSDANFEQLYQLSLEMVHDAVELYMLETGWTHPTDPVPMGAVYSDVLAEMSARANFLADKDLEYGQPTRRHGIYGVVIRVFDKISRYTTLKAGKLVPKFESCADSLKDLGGYSMILAGALQEEVIRGAQDGTTHKADA